jgi:menaquinone-dependent protoporphyrinogen IX oxidase
MYDAAALGAAVYTRHIVDYLQKFVAKSKSGLVKISIAAFAVGLAAVDPEIGSPGGISEQFRTCAGRQSLWQPRFSRASWTLPCTLL